MGRAILYLQCADQFSGGDEMNNCEECGKILKDKKAGSRFCSPACKNKNWCKKHPRVKVLEVWCD